MDEEEKTIYCYSKPLPDFSCYEPANTPPGADIVGYFGPAADNAI